ncbi:MAG: hypothetical protein HQ559_03285 [Lentisphaerae bacterium]|nr:hypothetical protein [Lentisphaerota bacterium]
MSGGSETIFVLILVLIFVDPAAAGLETKIETKMGKAENLSLSPAPPGPMLDAAMKKMLLVALLGLLAVAPCTAATVEFGPHAGYLHGNDLGKSPQSFGLHMNFNAPLILTVQLFTTRVGTRFDDLGVPNPSDGRALGTILADGWASGGSLILRTPTMFHTSLFLGAGMDYSVFRANVPRKVKFTVSPATGYHALTGATLSLGHRLSVFAEYRYSMGDVSAAWESAVGGPKNKDDNAPPAIIHTGNAAHGLQYGAIKLGLSFGL